MKTNDSVSQEDRAKARFIGEIRAVYERHMMMVVLEVEDIDDGDIAAILEDQDVSAAFAVAKCTQDDIDRAIQQMMIMDIMTMPFDDPT